MYRGRAKWLVPLLLPLLVAGCVRREKELLTPPSAPPQAAPEKKRLYVRISCGYLPAAARLISAFLRKRPEIEVKREIAVTSVHVAKIALKGDRPEVLMAMGDLEVKPLARRGLVSYSRIICYNSLALITPPGNPAKIKRLKDIASPRVKTLGLLMESFELGKTTLGWCQRKLLKEAGLWEKVKDKAVLLRLPMQLLHHTVAGRLDAAIHFVSCARKETPPGRKKVNLVEAFDKGEFKVKIPCHALVIKGCKEPQLGREFVDFLVTPEAQRLLETYAGVYPLKWGERR